jgi:hypothetical protein
VEADIARRLYSRGGNPSLPIPEPVERHRGEEARRGHSLANVDADGEVIMKKPFAGMTLCQYGRANA